MREIVIAKNEAGQRLDKFLGKYMRLAPKSFLYKMLRKKNITLNGKKAEGREQLAQGDRVKLFLSDETIEKFSVSAPGAPYEKAVPSGKPAPSLMTSEKSVPSGQRKENGSGSFQAFRPEILYEDDSVIFFAKPAGMLSQKAKADDVSLTEYLIDYLLRTGQITPEELRTFRPSVCSRLDRNTTGIVACGKTLAALQKLSELFRERTVGKYYLCAAAGGMSGSRHVEGYLLKDEKTNRVRIYRQSAPGAVHTETEYTVLDSGSTLSLAEVHLITGKTHQIRAQFAAIGHPLAGDPKYGNPSLNAMLRKKYGLNEQLLHCSRLVMPTLSGELAALSGREITAPLPEKFREVCKGEGLQLPEA